MWWIIGIVGVLVLFLIIKRGRRVAAHQALVVAVQNQVRTSYFTLTHELPSSSVIGDRYWDDDYLLGYTQGSVAALLKFVGGGLNTEQKGMVFVEAVRGLAPHRWQQICERVAALARTRTPDYERGVEHAANVVGLSMNRLRPEVLAEPDIQAALADSPNTDRLVEQIFGAEELGKGTPFSSAAASLMTMYMERHRKLAGY